MEEELLQELSYHDRKEEIELMKSLAEEDKTYLINQIILKNRKLDQLERQLQATETNEETYRLEMQEITKIFGLDEHTIFDEVKEYARKLVKEREVQEAMVSTHQQVIKQLEEDLANEEEEREYYQAIVESWE